MIRVAFIGLGIDDVDAVADAVVDDVVEILSSKTCSLR